MPAHLSRAPPDIAVEYHTAALNNSAMKIIDKHAELYADVLRIYGHLTTAATRLGTGCPSEVHAALAICVVTMGQNG